MHRHFRMIAISEWMYNRGFDPDIFKHTRIPGIWAELATFYDLDAINVRDNEMDIDPEKPEYTQFKEFCLPHEEFYDDMMERVLDTSRDSSPAEFDPDTYVPQTDEEKKEKGEGKKGGARTG